MRLLSQEATSPFEKSNTYTIISLKEKRTSLAADALTSANIELKKTPSATIKHASEKLNTADHLTKTRDTDAYKNLTNKLK